MPIEPFTEDAGQDLFAIPATWTPGTFASLPKVVCTEVFTGSYTVDLDYSTHKQWWIYVGDGTTAPSNADDRIGVFAEESASSSTTVLPVIGYVDRRISASTIPLFVGETEEVVITCVDGNTGEAIDVEAMTIELVVETRIKGDVKVYTGGELTKLDNTVRFTPTSAMVTSERTLNFAHRQSGTKAVVVYGIMTVTYAPRSGTS